MDCIQPIEKGARANLKVLAAHAPSRLKQGDPYPEAPTRRREMWAGSAPGTPAEPRRLHELRSSASGLRARARPAIRANSS